MAGCGSTVPLDDDSSTTAVDSDGDTVSGTDGDTEPPTSTTAAPECVDDSDCGLDYECIDGICVLDDCLDDCCTDGCSDICYFPEECDIGELCRNAGYCYGVDPVPECADVPLPRLLVPLESSDDVVVSLSVIDVDGDGNDDVVVSRASGDTHALLGGGAPVPLPFPAATPVLSVVSGDFDGDGVQELAGNTADGEIAILDDDGMGGFVPGPLHPTDHPFRIQTLDWNGDGALDFAGVAPNRGASVALGDGMAGITAVLPLDMADNVQQVEVGRFQVDAFDDLALNRNTTMWLYDGNDQGQVQASTELSAWHFGGRFLLADDFDGGGLTDVVVMTRVAEWTLLDTWRDGEGHQGRQALLHAASWGITGDLSGDGLPDAIMTGTEGSTVVLRGSPAGGRNPIFTCTYALEELPFAPVLMAAGDTDGDGVDALIISDGLEIVALLPTR